MCEFLLVPWAFSVWRTVALCLSVVYYRGRLLAVTGTHGLFGVYLRGSIGSIRFFLNGYVTLSSGVRGTRGEASSVDLLCNVSLLSATVHVSSEVSDFFLGRAGGSSG